MVGGGWRHTPRLVRSFGLLAESRHTEAEMRFMMFVRADKNTESGVLPSKELVAAMGRFNEEMAKAGVLLAAEGIQPSAKGARVTFGRGAHRVTSGPFPA